MVKNTLESGKSCKNNSQFFHRKKDSVKVGKLVNLGNLQSSPCKMTCPKFWASYLKVVNKFSTISKPFEDQTTFTDLALDGIFWTFSGRNMFSIQFFARSLCHDRKKDDLYKAPTFLQKDQSFGHDYWESGKEVKRRYFFVQDFWLIFITKL